MRKAICKILFLIPVMLLVASPVCLAMSRALDKVTLYVEDYPQSGYSVDILVEQDGKWMSYSATDGGWQDSKDHGGEETGFRNVRCHRFTFGHFPHDDFKAVIQERSGSILVSNEVSFKTNAVYLFRYQTGELRRVNPFYELYAYRSFHYAAAAVALIFIVLIKLLIAIPFKIKPLGYVTLTALFTQLLVQGSLYALFALAPFDFTIPVFIGLAVFCVPLEFFILKRFSRQGSRKRLVIFTCTANAATFFMGFFLLF